jgi:hypothetical protein
MAKRVEVMYGVKYVNSPGMIALYAYRQDAVIRIADAKRRIQPKRLLVTYDDGKPVRRKRGK